MAQKVNKNILVKIIKKVKTGLRMQVDELPQVTPDVDYTEILPIQQKRTIAFVNHFIMTAVSYLNNFAQSCESRFMEFEYKMQKIEASLLILEAQLLSIPGYDKPKTTTESSNKQNITQETTDKSTVSTEVTLSLPEIPDSEKSLVQNGSNNVVQSENSQITGTKASEDPRYAKFFKMLRVGVQEQAVKLKMKSEGFDPTILDNPDAILPDPDNIQES